MDNFPKFIRNVETDEFRRLVDYKINLHFKATKNKWLLFLSNNYVMLLSYSL